MTTSSILAWNKAVSLRRPTVSQLLQALSVGIVEPVFPHSSSIFSLGSNLVFKIPPATAVSDACPVLSVALVTIADFFVGAAIRTNALPPFAVLGHKVPCSARELVDHIRRHHPGPLSLGSMKNRWLVNYGDAFALTFLAGENTDDPADSRLAYLEFYYQLPYRGATTVALDLPGVEFDVVRPS